jgi:hypothetical protein
MALPAAVAFLRTEREQIHGAAGHMLPPSIEGKARA